MIKTTKFVWIRRRARRLQSFYKLSRRIAIVDAWLDWIAFSGATP